MTIRDTFALRPSEAINSPQLTRKEHCFLFLLPGNRRYPLDPSKTVRTNDKHLLLKIIRFSTYWNVILVHIVIAPLLRYQQDFVKQKECSLIPDPMDTEGALQDQLPISSEVWTLPVNK